MSNAIKVIDLFYGTGGFSKGFENSKTADYQVVLGIDIRRDSLATFAANHGAALAICRDLRGIDWDDMRSRIGLKRGELGVVIGGPPCQGFSSLRPNRSNNLDDPRNHLFHSFATCVEEFQPPAFVMENVVGLATHNGGRDVSAIAEAFMRAGYETDWKI